jgi:hypothetical protein
MSLVNEQAEFLLDVCKLVEFAAQKGFVVTGGELWRPIEMQQIYVKTGRSKTMASNHLRRCAVDLNFFIKQPDGTNALTYDIPTLKPLGDYWEQLRPGKNSWGGNWSSFKDVPHFERRA